MDGSISKHEALVLHQLSHLHMRKWNCHAHTRSHARAAFLLLMHVDMCEVRSDVLVKYLMRYMQNFSEKHASRK